MRRLAIPLLSLLILTLGIPSVLAQTATAQSILQPGTSIERTMGPNESHSYTINLDDEQYLQFVVNQQGIDLIVRVFSPAGKSLGSFDTPNGTQGPENVSIVAITKGAYRIVVSPLDSNTVDKPGRYEIKTLEIRQATGQEVKVGNDEETRKQKGIALLNEIVNSIPEIRQPQTRVRVKLQSASLLWTIDEKKATKLLHEAVTDARNYMLGLKPDDQSYDEAAQWTQQIRFEAVQTLAFHDPEAALNLLRSTKRPANTESNRWDQQPENQIEMALASQIAAKNPQRAFELAEESLKTGFTNTLVQTVNSLARVNADLAAVLGKDINDKLLAEKLLQNNEALDLALSFLRRSQQTPGKQSAPALSDQDYRALVQKLFNEAVMLPVTEQKPRKLEQGFFPIEGGVRVMDKVYITKGNAAEVVLRSLRDALGHDLDRIIPGATVALEKKLNEFGGPQPESYSFQEYEKQIANSSSETARETINHAPPEIRNQLLQQLTVAQVNRGNLAEANQLVADNYANPRERQRALTEIERQAAYVDVNQGRMDEALKHISKISNADIKAEMISELAGRIGSGQKRDTALALLETARSILGTSIHAEGQTQMLALLQLAGAFSRYDVTRGFAILEPLIDQFNDLSEAARTINGFGQTYFVDGELSLQNGNTLANIAAPIASAVGILSLVDFDRAKSTSDRLNLPEVKLTVHLNIVQQAIQPNGLYSPSVANLNSLNR